MEKPHPLQTLTDGNVKEVLVVVNGNYQLYHSLVNQLEGLQEWVVEQEVIWNRKEKDD